MATDSPADPFVRPNPTRESLVRVVALVAVSWGACYLVWRVLATLTGVHPVAASVLLGAEVLGVIVFALRVRAARPTPVTAIDAPHAVPPDLTVVIDAHGASIEELRTTLVSVARLEGSHHVTIVGADDSRWLRSVAERFGATVMDPSITAARAIAAAPTEWVLRLSGGDIPLPDLVTMCAPVCAAPDVGVVQVGIEEADPVSFDHDVNGRWSLSPFEQQVVRPSLASRGSIPWFGFEPVLVRTEAFIRSEAASGEDMPDVQIGIVMQEAGYHVTCVPVTLARVRGPGNLGESLARRHQRLQAQARAAIGGAIGSLARPARWSHRVVWAGPLAAVQRLMLVAAAVLVLVFGQQPLSGSLNGLVMMAVPAYLLRWTAHLLLGRGRLRPLAVLRSDLRTLSADLSIFRGPRAEWRGNLRLLGLIVLVLAGAEAVTALSVWRDWSNRLPAETAAISLVVTAGFLGVAFEVLFDLSFGGAGVVLPVETFDAPELGLVTTVAFRIPDAEGSWRNVSTLVHVAHVAPGLPGETRVGLAFDDPTDAPLDPVVEFLTIDRRLVTLGRREMVGL